MRGHSPGGWARAPEQMHGWPGPRGQPEVRKAVGAAAGRRRWLRPEGARNIRCGLNLLRC